MLTFLAQSYVDYRIEQSSEELFPSGHWDHQKMIMQIPPISLMIIRKNTGPKTVPCGKLEKTGVREEFLQSTISASFLEFFFKAALYDPTLFTDTTIFQPVEQES